MNALIYKGNRVADWLGRRSVDILRVSLGLIFLGFGVLKFFPGASPAEALVMRTVDTFTFGIIHGRPTADFGLVDGPPPAAQSVARCPTFDRVLSCRARARSERRC